MARPGLVLRGALVTFGAMFLPLAIWFVWKHFWGESLAVGLVAVAFLRSGLSHDEDSWMSAIDALGKRNSG